MIAVIESRCKDMTFPAPLKGVFSNLPESFPTFGQFSEIPSEMQRFALI